MAQTFDWKTVTPYPCSINDNTTWGEPQEFRFCSGDPGLFLPPTTDNCCWNIIYYQRWTGTTGNEYEINIVGIYSENDDPECLNAINEALFFQAYILILQKTSQQDPNWKSRIESVPNRTPIYIQDINPPYDPGTWVYIYSTGTCKDGNNYSCNSSGISCCRKKVELLFSNPAQPNVLTTWDNLHTWEKDLTSCPEPCINCADVVKGVDPDICNNCKGQGSVVDRQGQFTYYCCSCESPQCVGCTLNPCVVKYSYKVRTNLPANCPYHDYELSPGWNHCDNICSSNDLTQIHAAVIQDLLTHGEYIPPVGETMNDIRVTEAQCWQPRREYVPMIGWRDVWKLCPGNIFCCQTIWSVFNNNNTIIPTRLPGGTTPGQQNCIMDVVTQNDINSQLCHTFCSEPPVIIMPSSVIERNISFYSFIMPNPGKDYLTIRTESTMMGVIELKIFNSLGEKVYSAKLNKFDFEIEIGVNLSNLASGSYYYQFYQNDTPVSNADYFYHEK